VSWHAADLLTTEGVGELRSPRVIDCTQWTKTHDMFSLS
jgi:hypothetical protein